MPDAPPQGRIDRAISRPPHAAEAGAGPTGGVVTSSFRAAWWLPGPHLQTIWPVLAGARLETRLRRERLELPDGDFLDLEDRKSVV